MNKSTFSCILQKATKKATLCLISGLIKPLLISYLDLPFYMANRLIFTALILGSAPGEIYPLCYSICCTICG